MQTERIMIKNGMTTIEEVERVCLLNDSDSEEK